MTEQGIENWISNFNTPHSKLYLIHGEAEAKIALQERLSGEGWSANIPESGESISF